MKSGVVHVSKIETRILLVQIFTIRKLYLLVSVHMCVVYAPNVRNNFNNRQTIRRFEERRKDKKITQTHTFVYSTTNAEVSMLSTAYRISIGFQTVSSSFFTYYRAVIDGVVGSPINCNLIISSSTSNCFFPPSYI